MACEEDKEFPPLGIDLAKLREIPHHAYSQLFTAFRLVQSPSFISQIKCLTNLFDDLFCKVNQVHFECKNVLNTGNLYQYLCKLNQTKWSSFMSYLYRDYPFMLKSTISVFFNCLDRILKRLHAYSMCIYAPCTALKVSIYYKWKKPNQISYTLAPHPPCMILVCEPSSNDVLSHLQYILKSETVIWLIPSRQ